MLFFTDMFYLKYAPILFPSVGGTMGPEYGKPEIACMADTFNNGIGPEITTGGGFSFLYDLPSWQSTAVNHYFSTSEGQSLYPGHSRGRVRSIPVPVPVPVHIPFPALVVLAADVVINFEIVVVCRMM